MRIYFSKSKTLLFHGVETDWIEEELGGKDGEFLKDVLEQKITAMFISVGFQQVKNVSRLPLS